MPPKLELATLLQSSLFTAMDKMIVEHLREEWNVSNEWILFAAALCSLSVREGHTFLDLKRRPSSLREVAVSWPSEETWDTLLANGRAIAGPDAPLILADGSCLYLNKYYTFEQRLAGLVKNRVARNAGDLPQAAADPATIAAKSSFYVITGGPGTGKTTLALRYLNLLLNQQKGNARSLRIATVAPTGKAAARLSESIVGGIENLELTEERRQQLLSIPCLTIHRLLGALPHRAAFRHDAQTPIPFDALIVDESSMIDLPLMLRLFESLSPECSLLLLGDRDQLSSVEVGSVFSDLLDAGSDPQSQLASSISRLEKTYRFSEDSTIYRICNAAREGDLPEFESILKSKQDDWLFHPLKADAQRVPGGVLEKAIARHNHLLHFASVEEAIEHLNDSMILTPTRKGPFGSEAINRSTLQKLRHDAGYHANSEMLPSGAPITILENDYERNLFNGDIGLVWFAESQRPRAFFRNAEGSVRSCSLTELPKHEAAFALTIHKSQGSEFSETICLFPPNEKTNLSRELIYTAFSRAKQKLVVVAEPLLLGKSVERTAERATRLARLLS